MIRRKYLKQVMAFATAISMVLPQTAVYAEDMSAQQSNVEQTSQEQNEPVKTYPIFLSFTSKIYIPSLHSTFVYYMNKKNKTLPKITW